MNLQQMRGQVVQWIGLQDITAYNETTLAEDLLYQGTLDLLSRTKCVARCVNLNVSAGIDTYTLDHAILALVDIEDGSRRRARRDEKYADPSQAVIVYPPGSTPLYAPLFTLIRADVLRLQPTPSADGTIQVWGVLKPIQMTGDTDSPDQEQYGAIPPEWHDAIVTYALWKAADYADDASAQQGERYRALYEGADGRGGRLAQIRIAVNKRGTARGARRKVRLRPVASNEVWIG